MIMNAFWCTCRLCAYLISFAVPLLITALFQFCMHTSLSSFISLYLLVHGIHAYTSPMKQTDLLTAPLLRRFHDGTSPYVLLACHCLPLHGPIFSLFIIAHSVFIGFN
ncbi:MAG: hypothetical protein NXY57DRAFT_266461 [Lentinula lateritia]|nr:MAG: hypothetical protein NXY57DRAFT_266461 [Lentinula lateritia]